MCGLQTSNISATWALVKNTNPVLKPHYRPEQSASLRMGTSNLGFRGFPGGSVIKDLPAMQESQEMQFRSLSQKDSLEKEMATDSSILAWRIPQTEESGGLKGLREPDRTEAT